MKANANLFCEKLPYAFVAKPNFQISDGNRQFHKHSLKTRQKRPQNIHYTKCRFISHQIITPSLAHKMGTNIHYFKFSISKMKAIAVS